MSQHNTQYRVRRLAWSGVLLIACGGILVAGIAGVRAKPFRLIVFDIGQGDALFVETPQGFQMLLDGGPSNAVLEKLGRVMRFWDRSLDVVVLTHPDADHLTGLVEVIRRYHVGTVLLTTSVLENDTYRAFRSVLADHGVPLREVHEGMRFALGGATLSVLSPPVSMNPTTTETNASSIVARLSFSAFSALLAADADASVERQLLSTDQLDSTILKVGHHGSRSSSSNEFLAAVNPEVALISVGAENSFGHPNTETLTRFQEKGIPVLRTDQGGDIRFNSNGEGYTIHRGLGFRLW